MVWQWLLTLVDLVNFGTCVVAVWVVIERRAILRKAGGRLGPWAVTLGLTGLGLFHIADLLTMWVLPELATPTAVTAVFQDLHLNYGWTLALLALSAALVGLTWTVRALADQASTMEPSEKRHQALYEKTPAMLHSINATGHLVSVSDRWLASLGYERQEVVGRRSTEFLTPVSREQAERSHLPEFLKSGRAESIPYQMVRKDGQILDVLLSAVAERDADGRFARSLAVVLDVTEVKRVQFALADSEERYRRVFEASVHGLTIRRLEDGHLIAANPAIAWMHGYSREEFMRLSPPDYVPEDFHHLYREATKAVRRGEKYRFVLRSIHKHGHFIDIEGCAIPFPYKGEAHILTIAQDITKQKEAERERRRAFEDLARLKDELERERDYLREEVNVSQAFGEIVGDSPALKRVLGLIEAVARTDATILILGESGVGKELIARAIHSQSDRESRPLVKVNCASIPRDLFESEFFGHVKGAFTGALQHRMGRFQLADGGTLLLDEVAEIPIELQGKLLRVLEEGEYERVGEDVTRQVDVRVLAATNRDLEAEVEVGRFREDLYFRLSVFPLQVPPLRERRGDIVVLARHFLKLVCQELGREEPVLSRFQADELLSYSWPGNVRELRNVIERSVILSRGRRLRLDFALPSGARIGSPTSPPVLDGGSAPAFLTAAELRRIERDSIRAALQHADWRVAGERGAARLLGLKPSTLRYKMKSMGISRPS